MPPETNANNFSTKFCFTKASLNAALTWFLAYSDKDQLDCYDTKCVGLIAVLYRGGRINFRSRPILHGQRLSLALGDYSPQFTVEQARSACAAIRIQAGQGIDPRSASRNGITFGQLWSDHYYPAVKNRKRSIKDDVQKFERWLSSEFGHMPLAAIKSSNIVAFLDMLREQEELSPATVNRYLALLKAIWRHAVENDLCPKSPAKHIRPLLELNIRTRVLDSAERLAFKAACKGESNRAAASLFMLLFLTAARLGEALGAKVADINLDSGVWYLPMTKSGKAAHICLSSAVVQLLRDVIGNRKNGYLFPGKDPTKPMTRPAKAFERICASAGINAFTIHDLRRTWASIAVNAGVPLFTVSKALRHSSPNVTAARYAHLQDQALIDANNLVGGLV
ncbi:tyrosine-type recombinase/integrase [Telluria aromaticivorans]|uniref:Tyrosine-type recombinase/integrase n=1 Tax=Telluria aromaticivorans TaxID=2725995 RepID=A0A7Y2NZ43_9BURK|nr:tyrosine-type recombinase/integrase [Telluria aromaticivorans]NNG22753.1 tyrosine-type recombinase/integrase [Telluria aromaticivorans]